MMSTRLTMLLLVAGLMRGSPLPAAPAAPSPSHIVVLGNGEVLIPPDIAKLSYTVRGEGATADAAAKALVAKRANIESGIATISPEGSNRLELRTGDLKITEARAKACDKDDYGDRPQLSVGDCKIVGYIALLDVTLRLTPIKDAGTLVARASQFGASDVTIDGYELSNEAEAQRQAMAAAVNNARATASAIATTSNVRLGELLSVEDDQARAAAEVNDILVTAKRSMPMSAPAEVIVVDVAPAPIKVSAKLIVTYAITP